MKYVHNLYAEIYKAPMKELFKKSFISRNIFHSKGFEASILLGFWFFLTSFSDSMQT